jgi:hypothetical protein
LFLLWALLLSSHLLFTCGFVLACIREDQNPPLTLHSEPTVPTASVEMASTPKFTSLDSSSGVPTPPHPTPATDAKSEVGEIPVTDLDAVDKTLRPIQEQLNEAAEEAKYSTPPVNSPAFSPAPSVIIRQIQRSRGLSTIGDRLALLAVGDATSSNHSDAGSGDEEDEQGGVVVPIMLGSPTINPLLHHYMSHRVPSSGGVSLSNDTDKGKDGVCEKSNWADEVMDYLERSLLRLEQLAIDEGAASKTKSAEDFYRERLLKVLEAADRKYPVSLKD